MASATAPEFYKLTRTLEAYQKLMDDRTKTMESILPKVKLLIMNPKAEGRPAR